MVVRPIRRNARRSRRRSTAVRRLTGMAYTLCLFGLIGVAGNGVDLVHLSRVAAWLRGQAPVTSIRDLHARVVGIGWAGSFILGTLCVGLLAKRATGGGEVR